MFMLCRDELDFAGAVIDSQRFAATGDCMKGKLALSACSRLADSLLRQEGDLDVEVASGMVEGSWGAKPALHLRVSGALVMRCQRCLAEVVIPLGIDKWLLPLRPDEDWPDEELEVDAYDAIPADRALSLAALVEDEVLLAMPIVPRHEDCALPFDASRKSAEGAITSRASPFAVLESLKKH